MALELRPLIPINPLQSLLADNMSAAQQLWCIRTNCWLLRNWTDKDIMVLKFLTQIDFNRQLFRDTAAILFDNLPHFGQFRNSVNTCFNNFKQRRLIAEVLNLTEIADKLSFHLV